MSGMTDDCYLCDNLYDEVLEYCGEQNIDWREEDDNYDVWLKDVKEQLLMRRISYNGIMQLAQGNQSMIYQCELFDAVVKEAFDDYIEDYKKEEIKQELINIIRRNNE
jgi:hypothetical protein